MPKKGVLGKGLDALFEDNSFEAKENIRHVRLTDVEPNKNQPRKDFDDAQIQTLADSINEYGLISPIIVRPIADERYQIVAGERRWRACKMAGVTEIPIIIKDLDEEETAKIALIENLQRSDLNPIEESSAYKQLMDNYGLTQEAVSKIVGKSRSVIANSVRLLSLPEKVQDMLKNGSITVGHAKALAAISDEEYMTELAEKAASGEITVRNIEKAAQLQNENEKPEKSSAGRSEKVYYTEMELSLSDRLGRKVRINSKKNGKGTLVIDFFDKDDLSVIAEKLSSE